jgi:hypothetical protein
MKNRQYGLTCAFVMGETDMIDAVFPFILVANKVQQLRFQHAEDAQDMLNDFDASPGSYPYATLEWHETHRPGAIVK